jgi:adenylate cyclase
MAGLRLRIIEGNLPAREYALSTALELGRQRQEELAHELYALLPASGTSPARLLVARQQEGNVSRQHLLLEPLPAGTIRVSNRSPVSLACEGTPAIPPGTSRDLSPPFRLLLPPRAIEILAADSLDEHGCQSLDQPSLGPAALARSTLDFASMSLSGAYLPVGKEVLAWLHATMSVLQSAVGATDFLDRAAAALVRIVGLDSGRVLLRDGDNWTTQITQGPPPPQGDHWRPSRHVLDRLLRERRAVWQRPRQATVPDSASLVGLDTVVAAPLLDAQNNVLGALYGERRRGSPAPSHSGGRLEAMLVDLLACGVSTGLARQEQERAALRASALFEQFFTPQLARTLARQPDLLDGRQADVSVLFCDVRRFSAASEKLGPVETFRWMNDVMGELSACVQAQEGVLVDYIGDELMAMWGAPEPQADQAFRAVRAALAMLDTLPSLSERWRPSLGWDMAVGIGINSGPAQVGNTGSELKFKYGPLGNTVNLASRVQGLTKYLRCRFLVTRSTRQLLGDDFIARRVVRARVVNINEPADLYEVAQADPNRAAFFRDSEAALDALEANDFAAAARAAGALLAEHHADGPLILILSRASAALMTEGADFDPVWTPPGK